MSMHNSSENDLPQLARMIASLLAGLFVLAALAGLVLFNIEGRAFDPAPYKQALAGGDFYKQFPNLLGELLAENINGNLPAFLQHLSANQWKDLVEELLPESQLQSMTEDTLDRFFAYVNGENQSPAISLIPLKKSLAGPAGLNAALTIIRSQPDCTILQIANVIASFGGELCNPPQEILGLLNPVIQAQLQAAAAAIPDDLAILPSADNVAVESLIKGLSVMRLMMLLSPLIALALLFCITLIAVRTWKGWLVWWGWPFMLTGLLGVPVGYGGAPLFRWVIERWLTKQITLTLPPEVAASIRAVVDATFREILKPVVWESLALFIIGLIMISIAGYLTSREKQKPVVSKIRFK